MQAGCRLGDVSQACRGRGRAVQPSEDDHLTDHESVVNQDGQQAAAAQAAAAAATEQRKPAEKCQLSFKSLLPQEETLQELGRQPLRLPEEEERRQHHREQGGDHQVVVRPAHTCQQRECAVPTSRRSRRGRGRLLGEHGGRVSGQQHLVRHEELAQILPRRQRGELHRQRRLAGGTLP